MTIESFILSDPTLKTFCRRNERDSYDYDKLDWQITLHKAAFLIALNNYLNWKYPTKK